MSQIYSKSPVDITRSYSNYPTSSYIILIVPTSYTNITNPCMHACTYCFQYHMHEPLKAICAGFDWVHDTESGLVCETIYTPTLSPRCALNWEHLQIIVPKQHCCDLTQVLTPSSNKVICNCHFKLF